MELIYFVVFIISLCFYVYYYLKINSGMLKKIDEGDVKKIDRFSSIHSLIFMIVTVIILIYNFVFMFVFINKHGGSWKYIAPVGIMWIVSSIIVTFTGYRKKNIILQKYKEKYDMELQYDYVQHISLFRHTCAFVCSVLLINVLSMILN